MTGHINFDFRISSLKTGVFRDDYLQIDDTAICHDLFTYDEGRVR